MKVALKSKSHMNNYLKSLNDFDFIKQFDEKNKNKNHENILVKKELFLFEELIRKILDKKNMNQGNPDEMFIMVPSFDELFLNQYELDELVKNCQYEEIRLLFVKDNELFLGKDFSLDDIKNVKIFIKDYSSYDNGILTCANIHQSEVPIKDKVKMIDDIVNEKLFYSFYKDDIIDFLNKNYKKLNFEVHYPDSLYRIYGYKNKNQFTKCFIKKFVKKIVSINKQRETILNRVLNVNIEFQNIKPESFDNSSILEQEIDEDILNDNALIKQICYVKSMKNLYMTIGKRIPIQMNRNKKH